MVLGGPSLLEIVYYMGVLLIVFLLFKCLEYVSRRSSLGQSSYKHHYWICAKSTNQVLHCSRCKNQVDEEGSVCVCCGVVADSGCISRVNKSFKCKDIAAPRNSPMIHHWVLGNISVNYYCYVCEEDLSSDVSLTDYRCIWCDRTVHSRCKPTLGSVCDFGEYKPYIVPPQCVVVSARKSRNLPHSIQDVQCIDDPGWNHWTPLFVLGNSKSGNGRGAEVLSAVRRYLNPLQVVDLERLGSVQEALRIVSMLPTSARPRLIVAGGDGSVAWLLSDLQCFAQTVDAPVGIIPLGTGNDLARVLGWGSKEPTDISADHIFLQMSKTKVVDLDRWKVEVKGMSRFGRQVRSKQLYMYNYLSVGVDAMVTLKFHNTRKSPFYVFSSRIMNKLMYLWYGADQVLDRSCRDLESKVELYLDGTRVELPSVESIVILNIPSWGAGVPLWELGQDEDSEEERCSGEQQINDGLVEVAAIYSSFHIAQLQVGLSRSLRIGQASKVKVKLKMRLPMQIDGEPWMEGPGELTLSLINRAPVLQLDSTN